VENKLLKESLEARKRKLEEVADKADMFTQICHDNV